MIYRTTIHETAHFSQRENQQKSKFTSLEVIYKETFARGIEIIQD